MRTTAAPSIRLKDYSAPQFFIRDVHLNVVLDPDETMVTSTLTIVRNTGTDIETPLGLDGDELELAAVAVNGKAISAEDYAVTPQKLDILKLPKSKMFKLEITTKLAPAANTKLMGLYQSNGVFCTQCEAEGFRRITYFLDRPDVLSIYTVRLEADRTSCPVLLSNGNPVKKGRLPKGRHFSIWHDPHPKPSYLFAMVGGDLDSHSDKFKTASGRKVKLNIYVEKGKAELATFAMDSLKRSMVWDEQNYGCEYDLDVFNIVAVSDFNMGAMENKGLNVFNDKYVLANPDQATDSDYMHIEAIIAHEYFHNWTGNRITCRDWFQLCLKEGLTVYRDQEFSADERSRAVQRIHQVRILKAGQFPEDAGPLAHSVRPGAYREINNFYTATVYQKGAELVRMLATLVGETNYRKSTDLYLKRHDGRAAVVEDWLGSFEEATGTNLSQFSRWYEQAGTPQLTVIDHYDRSAKTYSLTLSQSTPATPGQSKKKVVPIPVRFGLIGKDGQDMVASTKNPAVKGDVIIFDKRNMTVVFDNIGEKPVPSILRGFSAPVLLDTKERDAARLHRASFDSDLYNRWEALNGYATKLLTKNGKPGKRKPVSNEAFTNALVSTTRNEQLEPAFRAQTLTLPSVPEIARAIGSNIDPEAVYAAHKALQISVGRALGLDGMKQLRKIKKSIAVTDSELNASGLRSLKNALLPLLTIAKVNGALEFARSQFKNADNMTDRLAALNVLLFCQNNKELADESLATFYRRYEDNHLVVDKWFSVQAGIPGTRGLKHIKSLIHHENFSLENPNRARSLIAPFVAGNLTAFHHPSGAGYKFFADQILALDKLNPQIAARLLTLMNNWKMFDKQRTVKAKLALNRIASTSELSTDVQEIVDRTLG